MSFNCVADECGFIIREQELKVLYLRGLDGQLCANLGILVSAKTHLQHIFMAAGLNLCRLHDWLNDIPLAATRYSRFMTLKPKTS